MHKHLHSAGEAAATGLKAIGCLAVEGKVFIHLIYDNIKGYHKSWWPSLESCTSLESRTATMLLMQRGVNAGAFDGVEYEQ